MLSPNLSGRTHRQCADRALAAIPTTPLYARLRDAGRLNGPEDTDRFGTNVVPLRLSREELRDGFINAMERTYTAEFYFERLDGLFIEEGFDVILYRLPYWRHHRLAWAKQLLGAYVKALVISVRLLRNVDDAALRSRYRLQLSARGSLPLAQSPHAIRLRYEDGDASSLRSVDAGPEGGQGHCGGHARRNALFFSIDSAERGSNGRAAMTGISRDVERSQPPPPTAGDHGRSRLAAGAVHRDP